MFGAIFETLKSYKKAAIALGILIVYSIAVLWLYVDAHDKLEEDTLNEVRLETEKHAAAISYFFSERRNDLLDLAASQEVESFFVNRDQGMSYQYDAGSNAKAIEARFERQSQRKRLAATPIYLGLALIDSDDQLIALIGPSKTESPHREAMRFANSSEPAVFLSADKQRIFFTAPVLAKSRYRGQIVAWSRIELIDHLLAEGRQSGLATSVIAATALPDLREGVTTPIPPELRKSLDDIRLGRDQRPDAGSPTDPIVAVVRIGMANSPFSLVAPISDKHTAERAMPVFFLILVGIVPLVVLTISFLDIFERKRSEELRQAARLDAERLARLRGDFLVKMSHEIRTPLNGVLGLAQIGYRDNIGRPDVLDVFARILDSGKRLLSIANNILDFAKIEAEKPSIEKIPVDVGGAINEIGGGISSRVDRPLAPGPEAATVAPTLPVPITSEPRLSGIRILAAEDDEVNRLILEDMLSVEGAHVTVVVNGWLAVEALLGKDARSYDLVLMDIQMPEMDGYEATKSILRQMPHLPIIALTAHALAEERQHCRAAGMIDQLTKPVDCETLVTIVLRHARPTAVPVKPAAPPAKSGVDWETLRARYAQRPEFLQRLLVTARSNLAGATAGLRTALGAKDSDRIIFLAHSLKSAAGNLIAHGLANQARAVELACRGHTAEAEDLAASLADAAEAVREEIQQQMALWDIDVVPPQRSHGTISRVSR